MSHTNNLNGDDDPPCLLVVDLQNYFMKAEGAEDVLCLIQKALPLFSHIVATRFINRPGSVYRTWMDWSGCAPESEESRLAFAPPEGALLLEKETYGCVDERLLSWLAARDIDSVGICGVNTDICVMKSALDLMDRGLRPIVYADLCASTAGRAAHDAAVLHLIRLLGEKQVRRLPRGLP